MAASNESVILDVKIENSQAVKNIADLKNKIDELRAAQKQELAENGQVTES